VGDYDAAYMGAYLMSTYDQAAIDELMSAQHLSEVLTGADHQYLPDYDPADKGADGIIFVTNARPEGLIATFGVYASQDISYGVFDDIFGLKAPQDEFAAGGIDIEYSSTLGDLSELTERYIASLVADGVFDEGQCEKHTQDGGAYYLCVSPNESGGVYKVLSSYDENGGATELSVCANANISSSCSNSNSLF
jgi:hypothetical protein